jgi:hypothetical protein
MQPEPRATTNGSCCMSRDIVWLSDGGDLGDLQGIRPLAGMREADEKCGSDKVVLVLVCSMTVDMSFRNLDQGADGRISSKLKDK